MTLRTELEALSCVKVIDALFLRRHEPHFLAALPPLQTVAEALRVPILVTDFDIEMCMSGMLGFLENETGLNFKETIEALDRIGAAETAAVLRAVQETLEKHGMTPFRLRADFEGAQEVRVTTFQETHGDLGTMPDEVDEDAQRLYLYAKPGEGEPVMSLLEAFVEGNRTEFIAELARISGE